MLSTRIVIKRGTSDEAEKPFWISFSDLMSALMVLFLVVMSVALLAVTKKVDEAQQAEATRNREISELLRRVQQAAREFGGVHVFGRTVDFGERARFEKGSYQLNNDQSMLLRAFVPKILEVARDPLGKKWLKQIVVEGFTSQEGTYLLNLNLSLERSQKVLCALLANPEPTEKPLSPQEKEQIRDLFLVGGYSFNSAKPTLEESRRIELKLEFLGTGEAPETHQAVARGDFGLCAI